MVRVPLVEVQVSVIVVGPLYGADGLYKYTDVFVVVTTKPVGTGALITVCKGSAQY